MDSLFILGRQPAIGLAELESLYGADRVEPVGNTAAVLRLPIEKVDFSRLGGTVKLCKILTTLPTTHWQTIQEYLAKKVPEHLQYVPDGKLQFGISTYGFDISARQIQATGLELKKIIRSQGRSVRIVPNQESALNSAQVLHNHLTGKLGWELVFVKNDQETILAQTVVVQDIAAYAARDQARPKRDARVGMLPPKLAQIIVNLAVGGLGTKDRGLATESTKFQLQSSNYKVLDPFCGTGVIAQEALLMGYEAYGADLDPRMVEYTSYNVMDWLRTVHPEIEGLGRGVQQADATKASWTTSQFVTDKKGDAEDVKRVPLPFDTIASETYLGRPFSAEPKPEVLQEVIQDVNTIHRKFLKNVARQTKVGFRMCLAVPAWHTRGIFKHLPVLDSLEELGYTRVSFVHAKNDDLIYYRPGQVVGRELVVLMRK